MMGESRRISRLLLERYNLGEVTLEERRFVQAALAEDRALEGRLEDLRRSDAEIRAAWPAGALVPAIGKKAGKAGARRFSSPVLWGLCAAAALFVVVLPIGRLARGGLSEDRAKGGTELSVYLEGEKGTKLADHAVVREGNTVQLAYMVSGGAYGVIFSIDGRSAVTLHYPYSPEQGTGLVPGRRILLEEAYTLDDAPDWEIFFFVTADKPLDVREILGRAESLARDPGTAASGGAGVFKGYEVKTVILRKEQRG
jgi:hypothetical protein